MDFSKHLEGFQVRFYFLSGCFQAFHVLFPYDSIRK